MRRVVLLYAGFLLFGLVSWFLFLSEPVDRVIDGDTLVLASGERVRLLSVDTPERGEPGFEQAKEVLTFLVRAGGHRVFLQRAGKDRYGRTLAHVYTPLPAGRLLLILRLAKPYKKALNGLYLMKACTHSFHHRLDKFRPIS